MKHDDSRIDLTPIEEIAPHEYRLAAIFWGTIILSCVAALAFADTVTYSSQTLAGTSTIVDGPATIPSAQNDVYSILVTISGPLAANLNMAMITPTAWAVTCQSCEDKWMASAPVLQPNMMNAASAVFMFSTDSTGKITAWNFAVNGNFALGDGNGDLLENGYGSYSSGDAASSYVEGYNKQITLVNSGPPGTWTQSSLSNPPVSAPAATVLARTCYSTWAAPNNNVGAGLTPNANGSGMNCRVPSQYPPSWYIKVTSDGGKTYEFVTLGSLGLGN